MPRNKELMRIFKGLDLVEHIGSGMGKIMTIYNKDNFEFMEHFLRIKISFEKGYDNFYPESNEESREKSMEKRIRILSANLTVTMAEIAKQLDLSQKAIEKQISQLKKIRLKELVKEKKTTKKSFKT